jgi:arabinose-5-phosphate isomerase
MYFKSGNSPEIVNLVPYLKDYSSALIGMTGNKNSKLAEFSEIILDTHVDLEACPNKLAPTSSTTFKWLWEMLWHCFNGNE